MRKGKIKNSIVTIAMAMMLSVTAVVGFETNAKAAAGNTGNKQYSYSNIDPIGSCEWRTKNNATKVYVYPTAGPKIYYEANGRKKNSITGQYEKFAGSYSYAIPTGTQGSITNWINEKGVTPDIKVEMEGDYYKNPSDETDNQLQKALEDISK